MTSPSNGSSEQIIGAFRSSNQWRLREATFGGILFCRETFRVAEVDHRELEVISAALAGNVALTTRLINDRPELRGRISRLVHELQSLPSEWFPVGETCAPMAAGSEHPTFEPVRAVFELTHFCNLHCPYCYSASGPAIHTSILARETPIEEISAAIAELCKMKIFDITFTGGEPTLRKEFVELCARLSDSDFSSYCLITNGSRLSAELLDVLAPFSQVCVSIDAVGTLHDEIRGQKGLFAKNEAAVATLLDRWPFLKILITVSTLSFGTAHEVISHFSRLGCRRFDFIPVRKLGRIRGQEALCLNEEQLCELSTRISSLRSEWASSGIDVNINSRFYDIGSDVRAIDTCKYAEYKPGSQLTISPLGDVYLDRLWSMETLGNIGNQRLHAILEYRRELISEILREVQTKESHGRLVEDYYRLGGVGARAQYKRAPLAWPSQSVPLVPLS